MARKLWKAYLAHARLHPTDALAGQPLEAGIDVARCASMLLACCVGSHVGPQRCREQLETLLAKGHIGAKLYMQTVKTLEALRDAWVGLDRTIVEMEPADWNDLPNGGHVRRVHKDADLRVTR